MRCYICKESTKKFLNNKTNISFYHCENCEFICKEPSLYQAIELQKERYDLHENSANSDGYRAYFQRFLDFTLPLVGSPKSALDFGCGESSLLASMLKEQNIECDYYDPIYHPKGLKAKKKYDLIVTTEVFEHLHKPQEVFATLLEHLNDGAYLAIQTEFHPNNTELFKKWYYHQDPTHIVFFRAKSFEVLANLHNTKLIADNKKNMLLIKK